LSHPEQAQRYYRLLAGKGVRIGMEATGSYRWFRRLLSELGHEMVLGNASQIRASCVRKQKTDKRDARHILSLLMEGRFPAFWQPDRENEELRYLLQQRAKLVRLRSQAKNPLEAMAKNEGLLQTRAWSAKRRQGIEGMTLPGWLGRWRTDLLEVLDELERRIKPLDAAPEAAAENHSQARDLGHRWHPIPRGFQLGSSS